MEDITYNMIGPLTKNKIKICIVGVFSNPSSTCIPFSKAFKQLSNVDSVIEYDYRKVQKENANNVPNDLNKLSKECALMIIMKGSKIPITAIQQATINCYTYYWFPDFYPELINKRANYIEFGGSCHYRSTTGYGTTQLWKDKENIPIYTIMEGTSPEIYYKENAEKIYDVSFIGGRTIDREKVLNYLKQKNVNVQFFGPGFNHYIGLEEFRKIVSESKITLNINKGTYEGYSSNRIWDLMCCCSPVITNKIPNMKERMNIEEEVHILSYSDFSDLYDKIVYLLNNNENREKIAKEGFNYTINNRTWKHVALQILDIVSTKEGVFKPNMLNNMTKESTHQIFKNISSGNIPNTYNQPKNKKIQHIIKQF